MEMANQYSEYLESSVQSPSKFRDMLESLSSNSEVDMDLWYENRQSDHRDSDPDLEFVLNALERIEDGWWEIDEPEIIERDESYHVELPVRYQVVRESRYAGDVEDYVLGATIRTDEGVEQQVPDKPGAEKVVH